jgi:hypothetical protein
VISAETTWYFYRHSGRGSGERGGSSVQAGGGAVVRCASQAGLRGELGYCVRSCLCVISKSKGWMKRETAVQCNRKPVIVLTHKQAPSESRWHVDHVRAIC